MSKKDTSLKRDAAIVGIGVLCTVALLFLANVVGSLIGENEVGAYIIRKVGGFLIGATLVSASIWTWIKYGWSNTLGKDFGDKFDAGWESRTSAEKADRILVATLVALIGFVLLWCFA